MKKKVECILADFGKYFTISEDVLALADSNVANNE